MGLKPMNCPAQIQIYNDERHSYRDLPVRYSEAGLLHRHEPSGVLHGLLRVRHFTQDDAHIFCADEQVEEEVVQCLASARPGSAVRTSTPAWSCPPGPSSASAATRCGIGPRPAGGALESAGLDDELNPGDGAFYGPKIDLHMTDSIGRPGSSAPCSWTTRCPSVSTCTTPEPTTRSTVRS